MLFKIQEEILKHGLDKIVEKYGLDLKEYPTKYLIKYNQINSQPYKTVQAVREARGIILSKETFEFISLPFIRFFNLGEVSSDFFDFESAYVQEKLDGSVIGLYWDFTQEKWCVQTSGTAEADVPVSNLNYDLTFQELFWIAANNAGFDQEYVNNILNKNYIFVFELQSKYNRVVVKIDEPTLTLLTIRDRKTGKEIPLEQLKSFTGDLNLNVIDSIPFSEYGSLEAIKTIVEEKGGQEFEGFVLVDKNHNRIKVKSKEYVRLAFLQNSMSKKIVSKKNIIQIILQNEQDEVIAVFPEHKQLFVEVENKINDYVIKINKTWNVIKNHFNIKSEKDYQYIVRKSLVDFLNKELNDRGIQFSFGFFMGLLDGKKYDPEAYIKNLRIKKLINLL